MSSVWGEKLKLSLFGGSHTAAMGCTIDGLPAGEAVDFEEILAQMARRAPGQDGTATPRRERDFPEILCGLLDGKTTGAPLTAVIRNSDQHSRDYSQFARLPRPGHADYPASLRYGGHNDIRGGGQFSGRLTAPLVFAGAVARQILRRKGVTLGAHVLSVGGVSGHGFPDAIDAGELERLSGEYFPVRDAAVKEEMRRVILEAGKAGDSVGGVVECAVLGMPAGLGDPIFQNGESVFSSLLFAIPAVKGVEFGAGFAAARALGSENNDPYEMTEDGRVRCKSNRAGGFLGGITTGMPIVLRAAFKPTPSIALEQDTVDLETGENAKLSISGRHDPCVVPRAAPAVEAAAGFAALALLLGE